MSILEDEVEMLEEGVNMLEERVKMLEQELEMLELFTWKEKKKEKKNVVIHNATRRILVHAPNATDSYAAFTPTHVAPKSTVSNV